jgi:hypothetical protein
MVTPPDLLLKTVRVTGSVLFVVGATVFFICAGQVYYNKFTRRGVALWAVMVGEIGRPCGFARSRSYWAATRGRPSCW